MVYKKKLIEVALPLKAINEASAREKSIRHGHPSTLHLWWARRPLAAARAVIFAQMVDDPSSHPEKFPTEEAQEEERQRLFRLIEDLVLWENTTNEKVLNQAREEIKKSCRPPAPPDTEQLDSIWEFACQYNAYEKLGSSEAVCKLAHEREEAFMKTGKWTGTLDELRTCLFFEQRRWRHIGEDPAEENLSRLLQLYWTIRGRWDEVKPEVPAFHDPFAGGGTLPLEAQRLGLESYASDLNPVAVLINKAMIEIPPKFAGKPPVNPESRKQKGITAGGWKGAQGLAEDVRYYGKWMRDEAEKRIGYLYPKVEITEEMAQERPDLKSYIGQKLTVIAWLWARTVKSPNPAFAHVDVPLASTFMLSTKAGKEAYVEPVIEGDSYRFTVKVGKPKDFGAMKNGTKVGRGGHFQCLLSGSPIKVDYIRKQGIAGDLGQRMMAIVAEGIHGRVYLNPDISSEKVAQSATPSWIPEQEINHNPRDIRTQLYGIIKYGDLFTPRQLLALTTFSDLVQEARKKVMPDALAVGMSDDGISLKDGGKDATAYADALGVYLACALDKLSDYNSAACSWISGGQTMRNTFGRQAIPMVWDYAEANILSESTGSYSSCCEQVRRVVTEFSDINGGFAFQIDAQAQNLSKMKIISTDPPYYDNIGYADLSDFFYVWMRRSLKPVFPELFATLAVPKSEELVATPYRHGSKEKAETFFMEGMTKAIHRLAEQARPDFLLLFITLSNSLKQKKEELLPLDGRHSLRRSSTRVLALQEHGLCEPNLATGWLEWEPMSLLPVLSSSVAGVIKMLPLPHDVNF